MSNAVFPKLRGLGWPVTHQVMFSTIVQESSSGMESRTALWTRPRKKWTLNFNYLAANPGFPLAWMQDDMRTLKGFQMSRFGRWDSFLFHDPMDSVSQGGPCLNTVTNGVSGDGTTLTFQLQRVYGSWQEPIYDLNPNGVNAINITAGGTGYTQAQATFTGNGSGAEGYPVIVSGAINKIILMSSGRDYTAAPTVTITGNGTGATATASMTPHVYQNGVLVTNYSIGPTGIIAFNGAPLAPGVLVTADCGYYWRCRFDEEGLEYSQELKDYFSLKKCVLYQTFT